MMLCLTVSDLLKKRKPQFTNFRENPAVVCTASPTWLFVNICSVLCLYVTLCNYVKPLDNGPDEQKLVADYRHLEVPHYKRVFCWL
jgi:hypothetical protein